MRAAAGVRVDSRPRLRLGSSIKHFEGIWSPSTILKCAGPFNGKF
jgi:hypothetical protein